MLPPLSHPQHPCLTASPSRAGPSSGKQESCCGCSAHSWPEPRLWLSLLGFHMGRHRLGVLWVTGRSLLVWVVDGIGPKGLFGHVLLLLFFSLCSSYLHCKWATLEELEKDPRISQKIKRFRNKQAQMKHIFTEVRAEHSKELCPTPAHTDASGTSLSQQTSSRPKIQGWE